MKRRYNIGVVKVELMRVWNGNPWFSINLQYTPHFYNHNWRDGMQAWFSAVHSHFFSRKMSLGNICIYMVPACSITGVIRTRSKPRLNGICQHSESFLKGSRLCEALGFPEAPTGQHQQWQWNDKTDAGGSSAGNDPVSSPERCPKANCWQALPLSAAALLRSTAHCISATWSTPGMFRKDIKVLSFCPCIFRTLFFSLRFYGWT